LGYTSETRWLRYARAHLLAMFARLPQQSGYNKRLRKLAPTMAWLVGALGAQASIAEDDVLVADSTPVECGRSRETQQRSDLAGWAEYGYCASHSRYFWGLRLHLVCTLHGLPVGWALTGAKADERAVLEQILANTPALASRERSPILITDKELLRPRVRGRSRRRRHPTAAPGPQGQEAPARAAVRQAPAPGHRVHQRDPQGPARPRAARRQDPRRRLRPGRPARVLALTAAIWHNDRLGLNIRRSLTAYDY